MTKKNLCRR